MSATTAFMGKVDKYVLKLGKILHYVEISLFLFGEKREKNHCWMAYCLVNIS